MYWPGLLCYFKIDREYQNLGRAQKIVFIFFAFSQMDNSTALHQVMYVEGRPDVVAAGIARQLLAHGACVDAQDKVGR